MLLSDKLAKEARKRGVTGMTRMYSGWHTVTGTYEDLMEFFRENNAFVSIEYANETYTVKAIKMKDGEVTYTETGADYYHTLHKVLDKLVAEMRILPKIKM